MKYPLIKQQEAAKIDFAIMLDGLLDTKGLTQSDLAVRAGKSKSLISRLMGGDSNPTVETMVSVLHAVGEKLVITTESRLSREYTAILSMQAANTLPDPHAAPQHKALLVSVSETLPESGSTATPHFKPFHTGATVYES